MKHKIDALTGLRFFAASAIVLHHMRDFPGISPGFLNDAILPQGVSVFFVLSGFILTYVYPALDKQGETSRFFLARFARVWPAHVVVLVAVLVVLRRNPAAGDLESGLLLPLIANTTLTHAFVPLAPFFFSFNAVSWSISTEVGFYLLFPLLIRNFAATWHWKLLLALGVSVSAALLASHFRLQGHVGPSLSVPLEGIVYVNPLARIFEFTLGMTAALGWREIRKHGADKLSGMTATVAEVAALVLLVFNVSITRHVLARFGVSLDEPMNYWVFMSFSSAAPAALLILTLATSKGVISKLLAWPAIRVLGEISFALYLTHQLVISRFISYQHILGEWTIPLCLITMLSVSAGLWYFIEMPARRHIMGLAPRLKLAPRPS